MKPHRQKCRYTSTGSRTVAASTEMGLINLILKSSEFGQNSGWSGCDRANLPGRCRASRRERGKQAHKAKDIRLAERLVQIGSVDAAGFLRLMEDDES